MSVFDEVASGLAAFGTGTAEVEIETAFSPAVRVNLSSALQGGEPSLLVRLLKPKVTVRAGSVVRVLAPAGEPGAGGGLLLVALLVGGAVVLWRVLR